MRNVYELTVTFPINTADMVVSAGISQVTSEVGVNFDIGISYHRSSDSAVLLHLTSSSSK